MSRADEVEGRERASAENVDGIACSCCSLPGGFLVKMSEREGVLQETRSVSNPYLVTLHRVRRGARPSKRQGDREKKNRTTHHSSSCCVLCCAVGRVQ